jgi:serine phosphatase RsbU (regulator of sigma subunit)
LFARAGHNPAIVFRSGASETRLLQTAGIGLDLELVQYAFDEVRQFAGDHPQHDDMTIVVLKAH